MLKISSLSLILALLAALLGGAATYTPARAIGITLFVKPTGGTGGCYSWLSACSLQTALNLANGDEIWVMAGTYIPDAADRTKSFTLKSGVAIYGGFKGTEFDKSQRDPAANVTILSGDLNGDDTGFTNNSENSYHVLRADSSLGSNTILDGFTIRGGNADGSWPENSGAGMLNFGGSPTLTNVTFSWNYASGWGGAIFNREGNLTLTKVTFSDNFGSNGGGLRSSNNSSTLTNVSFLRNSADTGGGMANELGSPTLTNVTFFKNTASSVGGGMYSLNTSPTLTNVIFEENSANLGGGMRTEGGTPTLTTVLFLKNTAGEGGGMYNVNNSPVLTNVTFSRNSAGAGGGIKSWVSSPTLVNVTFSGNLGYHGGGMQNVYSNSPTLRNVTFSGNTATEWGGGMLNQLGTNPTLTNVTFWDNSAAYGGGMYSNANSNPTLMNTIIAGSPTGGDCIVAGGAINAASSNNLIQDLGSACGLTNNDANHNIVGFDPKLGPLADNGGFTQTHAILLGSPAINKGSNEGCPAADQRGVARPQGGLCDIGAYEFRNFTISGNAGRAGVTLSYSDGTPKAVISIGNGNYSIPIPEGWSGTVTPTQTCFTFTPPSQNYDHITANQTQNYSATMQPTCAEVTVKIGQTPQATYVLPANSGERLSYAVDSGPMFVHSTGKTNVDFVASQRFIQKGTSTPLHFSEMMGLPDTLKSTKYVFPAYDNFFFNSQLRIANVGTANTSVTVRVGGVLKGSYPLGPNQGAKISYAGLSGGPVVVQSTGGVPIIASLRVALIPYNGSYSEMIGLPQSLVDTSYTFPWYNNLAPLDTQLRVGNVGAAPTTVTVRVGTTVVGTIPLAVGEGKRVNYPANGGPMKVTSSNNVQIVASLRVAFKNGNTFTSFSEVMGLPQSQQDTSFLFPWYNNLALDSQLRFANISGATASVRIYIGGVQMPGSPFTLPAGVSTRQSFSINNGPVKIVSSQPIVASMRVVFKNGNTFTSFSEMMGLPQKQLTNKYIFPWYNNLAPLDTQLRLGVP